MGEDSAILPFASQELGHLFGACRNIISPRASPAASSKVRNAPEIETPHQEIYSERASQDASSSARIEEGMPCSTPVNLA
jgi:hypothetical protein